MHKLLKSVVATSILLATPLLAQQPLLPFLPEETVMAVTVPNLDQSIGEFADMPLAKIWREQEVQAFVADAKTALKTKIDQLMTQAREMHAKGGFPVDPDKLMSLRVHGGTFALTKLEMKMGEGEPMPTVGMMLHLDFGDSAEQWNSLIQLGMTMLTQRGGDHMLRDEVKVGDTSIVCLAPKDAPAGMVMGLNVAMLKNGILIGTIKSEVQAVVENMQKGKQVLAATDRYKNTVKHLVADGAEAETFMRTDAMLDFAMQALELGSKMNRGMQMVDLAGVGRAVDALGMRSIQSIGAASTYKNGKAITTSYTVAPAPTRKGFFAGGNKTLDTAFLKWVPKDAVSFSASTMDPASIYDTAVAALNAYDEKFAKQMLEQLAGMEKQLGFSIRGDLFDSLGDTWMYWYMPMSGSPTPPESAFLMKVKDEAKIVKVLKTLTQMSDGMVTLEESEKRGVKSYQFKVNVDPTGGMTMNPFDVLNPTFAFKDGYMVAGFSSSDIRRVFQRMDRKDDDPKTDIRGNKEFAAYVDQIPQGITSLGFTDWKAQFESLYQLLTSVLAFVPMSEDVPIDMSLLPDAGTLTKHMFGSLSYSRADADGFESTTISPFGPEVGALIGGLVGAGAATAASMRKRF